MLLRYYDGEDDQDDEDEGDMENDDELGPDADRGQFRFCTYTLSAEDSDIVDINF
jgi:hypothetical protein